MLINDVVIVVVVNRIVIITLAVVVVSKKIILFTTSSQLPSARVYEYVKARTKVCYIMLTQQRRLLWRAAASVVIEKCQNSLHVYACTIVLQNEKDIYELSTGALTR